MQTLANKASPCLYIEQARTNTLTAVKLETRCARHRTREILFKLRQIYTSAPTFGGFILQIPYFSAIGLIFSMYERQSANSSSVGVKTGASGGGTKFVYGSSILTNNPYQLNPIPATFIHKKDAVM